MINLDDDLLTMDSVYEDERERESLSVCLSVYVLAAPVSERPQGIMTSSFSGRKGHWLLLAVPWHDDLPFLFFKRSTDMHRPQHPQLVSELVSGLKGKYHRWVSEKGRQRTTNTEQAMKRPCGPGQSRYSTPFT